MMNEHPKFERTLVIIKPDGVLRGLIGEIISRFEKRGLKIMALKMIWSSRDHIDKHYPDDRIWFKTVGERTAKFFEEHKLNLQKSFGTTDPVKIGKQVKGWMGDFMIQSPLVAMVIQGMHAISTVRKIVGSTYPIEALPGTIRGDFSVDTPTVANPEKRAIKNLIHASGNVAEATHEIKHWFSAEELHNYKRADEEAMF